MLRQKIKKGEEMTKSILNKKRKLNPEEILKLSYTETFERMFASLENMEIATLLVSIILNMKYELLENKIKLIPMEEIIEEEENETALERVENDAQYLAKIFIKDYCYAVESTDLNREATYYILVNFDDFGEDAEIEEYLYRNKALEVLTDKRKVLNVNIQKCYNIWSSDNDIKGYKESKKDFIRIGALLCITKKEEFKKCIGELNTSKKIKRLMENVVESMSKDEELLEKYFNKERDIEESY